MTDVKRLLEQATPLPWVPWTNGFDAGIVSDADGRDPKDRYRPLIFGGEPHEGWIDPDGDDVALVVYAVNTLPAYEAAVHALERLVKHHDLQNGDSWCEEGVAAREALRRVRGEPVEASR